MMKSGRSAAVPKASAARTSLTSTTPGGLVLNKKELRRFKEIAYENRDVEFLYLRENEFERFDPYISLSKLRVLDLSINSIVGRIEFLPLTPCLRHLYMTGNAIDSLDGISAMDSLETLCLSDNRITSFEGLDNLPNLRVLSLNYNSIEKFHAYPYLPALHTLNLVGNPVASLGSYRKMAIAASSPSLAVIDTVAILPEERLEVEHYRGKIVYCIAEGFVVDGERVEEQAELFLLDLQRSTWSTKPLQLQSISLASADESSNVLVEGQPVNLVVCLQDTRPVDLRTRVVFHSESLFPVTFKAEGDATEVLAVGSMNRWADPIPLERAETGSDVCFHTTLYLPKGDYEYRYVVDGKESVLESETVVSKHKQGLCNVCHVVPRAADATIDDTHETVLFIRWMRSSESNGFELIEGENQLTYTPTAQDIGRCLRAEVLAYEDGDFSFLYFDISAPISAGRPTCTKLEIEGKPVEGETLRPVAVYTGGEEGHSILQWSRVDAEQVEEIIHLDNGWDGYTCTLDDIGKIIKVAYTPIRIDSEAGDTVVAVTAVVAAGIPTCRSMRVIGAQEVIEDQPLTVEVVYSGGFEGASQFQWYHLDERTQSFTALAGETEATYTPKLHDVRRRLAVEYTPVSREGIRGDTSRCVLDRAVAAAPPSIRSIAVRGNVEEQHVLQVAFDYFGGYYGIHRIQWYSKDPSSGKLVKIGRTNHATCTLTKKEVGRIIEVEIVPVRDDQVQGSMVRAATTEEVRPALPQLRSLQIKHDGAIVPGSSVEAVAEYFGGDEGDSIIEWCVADAGAVGGFDADHPAGIGRVFVVPAGTEGGFIRVSYTPVRRNDGARGEPRLRIEEVKGVPQPPPAPAPAPVEPAPTEAAPAPAEETTATPAASTEPTPAPEASPAVAAAETPAAEPTPAAAA